MHVFRDRWKTKTTTTTTTTTASTFRPLSPSPPHHHRRNSTPPPPPSPPPVRASTYSAHYETRLLLACQLLACSVPRNPNRGVEQLTWVKLARLAFAGLGASNSPSTAPPAVDASYTLCARPSILDPRPSRDLNTSSAPRSPSPPPSISPAHASCHVDGHRER